MVYTEKQRVSQKKYNQSGKGKERQKKWEKEHIEQLKERRLKYYYSHRLERIEATKNWQRAHLEHVKEIKQKYNQSESGKTVHRLVEQKYRKTEKGKLRDKKHHAKQKTLGFIPLNNPFEGSDAHHIDKDHIIYIPTNLHQSIKHNIFTGENMDKINTIAIEYLKGEDNYGFY